MVSFTSAFLPHFHQLLNGYNLLPNYAPRQLHPNLLTATTFSGPTLISVLFTLNGILMTSFLCERRQSKLRVLSFFCSYPNSLPHLASNGPCPAFSASKLRTFHPARPNGRQGWLGGKQVWFPCGSSLPLSRMLHSTVNCRFHSSYCQIPFLLPHSFTFHILQKRLLISIWGNASVLPIIGFQGNLSCLNHRGFSNVNECGTDSGVEHGSEDDDSDQNGNDSEGCNVKSGADPDEVDRVCKVIDELFSLDRIIEAVLDECVIDLSHDLVVDVLERFKHARKPAFLGRSEARVCP